jgi:hypothetical protein
MLQGRILQQATVDDTRVRWLAADRSSPEIHSYPLWGFKEEANARLYKVLRQSNRAPLLSTSTIICIRDVKAGNTVGKNLHISCIHTEYTLKQRTLFQVETAGI